MLKRLLGRSVWEIAATLSLLLLDVVHWLVFEPINAVLRGLLRAPSVTSVVLLLAAYVAYIVALFVLGSLKIDDEVERPPTWQRAAFLYPTFGFGILLVMAATTVSGMTATTSPLSDNWQGVAVLGTTLLFFVHIGVQAGPRTPTISPSSPGYLARLLPVMLVSELMLNLSVALWVQFLGADAGPTPENASTLTSFVIAAPLFLLFFAAPRFTLLSRTFTLTGLLSGLALALWELWQIVDEAPLI